MNRGRVLIIKYCQSGRISTFNIAIPTYIAQKLMIVGQYESKVEFQIQCTLVVKSFDLKLTVQIILCFSAIQS